jgi:methanogenic corrinoid protein MtbC1
VGTRCPSLFTHYLGWAKVLLTQLGMPTDDLAENLRCMRRALAQLLPAQLAEVACATVDAGLQQLPQLPAQLSTYIEDSDPLAPLAGAYLEALLRGDRHTATRLILDAVQAGTPVKDIYLRVFQCSQYEIGRLWQMNKITVAQEHYCSAATQLIMSLLYPRILNTEKVGRTMVAACVQGDLHEIGIRIVSDFFELKGWETANLGANTPTSSILETLVQRRAHVLALSATMTFHVRAVAQVIEAVRAAAVCRHVKILVGGYPFNVAPTLWQSVGADACAPTAAVAVSVANRLAGASPVS